MRLRIQWYQGMVASTNQIVQRSLNSNTGPVREHLLQGLLDDIIVRKALICNQRV